MISLSIFLSLQIVVYDELEAAFPDVVYAQALAQEPSADYGYMSDAIIGSPVAIHAFVAANDGEKVTIKFSDYSFSAPTDYSVADTVNGGMSGGNSRENYPSLFVSRLHSVPVEENTGLGSRTEQFEGVTNPHVVRRAPFHVFDPIEPLPNTAFGGGKKELRVSAIARQGGVAFRIQLTPERAGDTRLNFDVKIGEQSYDLNWDIQTHDVKLIPRKEYGFNYTNWFSLHEIKERHNLTLWSEEFWGMLGKYANLMAYGGQDTFWLRWNDFFQRNTSGKWVLKRERLERYIQLFLDAGFHWIEGAPIASRPNGDWSLDWLKLNAENVPATGEAGEAILKEFAAQASPMFKEKGWDKQWIQHLADEPTDTNAKDYAKLSGLMRKYVPTIRIVEATMTRQLVGAIDIWCPQVDKYQQNREFFTERLEAGEDVWTYTCLTPGGPWLNRLLDQERLRQVYFGWAGAFYNTQGFLHWGLNHYKADPFAQSVVDHPAAPGTTNKLPAGDTHVVYPGPEGPWSSTRFEAHRMGLEDYAMLKMLKIKDPGAAESITGRLFLGYDNWVNSIVEYRKVRKELMEALVQAPNFDDWYEQYGEGE